MLNLRELKEKAWKLANRFDDEERTELRDRYTIVAQLLEELIGERDWGILELLDES